MNPAINTLTELVIGAAIEVHFALGPGLLESAYEAAYAHELMLRGIPHVRQECLPIVFKGIPIVPGYRIDILADNRVVIELKAVEKLVPLFSTQLLTYLRLGGYPLGLLINFNVPKLVDGIERVSNGAPDLSARSALSC